MKKMIIDVTPHPKILSVLGEIEFKPWQCVAELVDNCIDGFLGMERAGTPIKNPTVRVAFGRDTVVVKDNGPGMSIDALEMAVKAGWSSHDRFGNLGLYGVGFNIATARLGTLTTIWTTQAGDDAWYGVELDLQKLARGETFQLEAQSRMKSDSSQSGTEVEVSKIKTDWKDLFNNTGWIRPNITERLSSIYSTMLRDMNAQPIKFTLYVNDRKVTAWEHCTWPADWEVYRKNEALVRPIQEIDVTFGKKYISQSTGEMYDTRENLEENDVVEIPERVYGWIGIQRYADEKEYGIDILRNGRKIEVGCKDIFDWEDADGNVVHEYPIDDPRQRGRIVGEIHLDHGYVHYTKHRFEREHSSWKQLMLAVRKNEPLTNRERHQYLGVNESPLGLLFRVFRRNSPLSSNRQTFQDILFIKDNETAKRWAREYRKGSPTYKDDQKWREELIKSDPVPSPPPSPSPPKGTINNQDTNTDMYDDFILGGTSGQSAEPGQKTDFTPNLDGQGTSNDQVTDFTTSDETKASNTNQYSKTTQTTKPKQEKASQRTLLPELSFHITGIGASGKSYDVEVFASEPTTAASTKSAWFGRLTERNVYEIEVNLQHNAFNSTSLQVRDAILAQIAYLITFEETASSDARNDVNYGDVLVALRARYAITDSLDANHLRMEIGDLRKQITRYLAENLTEDEQSELLKELPSESTQRIELLHARGPKNAPAVSYLEMKQLAHLIQQQPNKFFDAGCFKQDWTPAVLAYNIILLDEHRKRLVREIWAPIVEMGEFVDDLTSSFELTKPYLALIRACINRMKEHLTDEPAYV